jgi:NADH-quinone oxidoreductase subunit G
MKACAHVVLPIGGFAETSGTFVSVESRWQSWAGAVAPLGEARPGWKVLRVLGNLLGLSGFEYVSSEQVRDELLAACAALLLDAPPALGASLPAGAVLPGEWVDIPIYQSDALVRRSPALAKTKDGQGARTVF